MSTQRYVCRESRRGRLSDAGSKSLSLSPLPMLTVSLSSFPSVLAWQTRLGPGRGEGSRTADSKSISFSLLCRYQRSRSAAFHRCWHGRPARLSRGEGTHAVDAKSISLSLLSRCRRSRMQLMPSLSLSLLCRCRFSRSAAFHQCW